MELKNVYAAQEYQEERFTKRVLFKEGESVVFVLNFLPGQELPVHKHPGTEVFLLALEGAGTMIVNGERTEMRKGDVVHVHGDADFAYHNTGEEPSSLYVMLNRIPDARYAQNV